MIDLWRFAPGLSIRSDTFLFDPVSFIQEHENNSRQAPEVFSGMAFFGGSDGFNGAIALDGSDPRAHEWSHEEGFTGRTAPTILHYLAESIACYATSFKPFCYQYGYVKPPLPGTNR